MGKSYLPKSPLSALTATGILAGFGADFMSNHAFGPGTVAVPVFWIDTLVPQTDHQAMCVKGSLLPFLAVAICGAA